MVVRWGNWAGKLAGALSALAAVMMVHAPVHAFSTRVHIVLSNKIRAALMASETGRGIQMLGSDNEALIDEEDADAIINYPAYFRAGAIGPDNFIFPAQTDPSHAVGHRPYEQCELLYLDAVMPYERAYALGCFLHGATDAMAHHYVNFLTGETFTLNPAVDNREWGFSNVIRHIVAESMIQDSFLDADPNEFLADSMNHTLPYGFILRNYYSPTADMWQLMGGHQREKWEEHVAENPTATFPELLQSSGLSPWEHLVLMPLYVDEIDLQLLAIRPYIEAELTKLKADKSLKPTAGPDLKIGTFDDGTSCSLTCPETYAKYFIYIGLLTERRDAWDDQLPAPIEMLVDQMSQKVHELPYVMVQTIAGLSAKLNEPLTQGQHDETYNLSEEEQAGLLEPLTNWKDETFELDYKTVVYSIIPTEWQTIDSLLANTGLNLTTIIKNLLKPIIDEIKKEIEDYIIGKIKEFLEPFLEELKKLLEPLKAEYTGRLNAASDPALGGNLLQHWKESGLYQYAFNITAVTLANHELILPYCGTDGECTSADDGGEGNGLGPSTFDASYTPDWSQPGVCDYLRDIVYPFGLGVDGLITVKIGDTVYAGDATGDSLVPTGDSPVECHDGAYNKFTGSPSKANCFSTTLDVLMTAEKGCLTRAFPPKYYPVTVPCRDLVVPGLPLPPAGGEGLALAPFEGEPSRVGTPRAPAATAAVTPPVAVYQAPLPQEIAAVTEGSDGGCQGGSTSSAGAWIVAALVGAWLLARRRRAAVVAVAMAGLAVGGCEGAGPGSEPQEEAATSTSTSQPAEEPLEETPAGEAPIDLTEEFPLELYPRMYGLRMADGVDDGAPEIDQELAGEAYGLEKANPSALLDDLGVSVWYGVQARYEGTELVSRAYELQFDAYSQEWGEIRNPYGPSRERRFRGMQFGDDGVTVDSVVITVNDWPYDPANGTYETWSFQIVEGTPRRLLIAGEGRLEEFLEGAFPKPSGGLTAHARAFSTGSVEDAFCLSGIGFTNGWGNNIDYDFLWTFARGQTDTEVFADAGVFGEDWVAGAHLMSWYDTTETNSFAITNVNGFDLYGGTDLINQYNFTVLYTGTITHPGGNLCMREKNDSVEDGVWAYIQGNVGATTDPDDLFLEVHGFPWPDETSDEPCKSLSAGNIPVEILIVRCAVSIEELRLELKLGSGSWKKLGEQPTKPEITTDLFPPVLY